MATVFDLIGPPGETAIQALGRLVGIKMGLKYQGEGYWQTPCGNGCRDVDVRDLDHEISCAANEALPLLLAMRDAIDPDGATALMAGNLEAIAWHLDQGQDNGGIPRDGLSAQLRSAAKTLKTAKEAAIAAL